MEVGEEDETSEKHTVPDWFFKPKDLDEEGQVKKEKKEIKSFSEPQGHFTIGIMNAVRGAGATWTANNLARYFTMHKYTVCIVDLSLNMILKIIHIIYISAMLVLMMSTAIFAADIWSKAKEIMLDDIIRFY